MVVLKGNDLTIEQGLYVTSHDELSDVVNPRIDPTGRGRGDAFFRNLYCLSKDRRIEDIAPHIS